MKFRLSTSPPDTPCGDCGQDPGAARFLATIRVVAERAASPQTPVVRDRCSVCYERWLYCDDPKMEAHI